MGDEYALLHVAAQGRTAADIAGQLGVQGGASGATRFWSERGVEVWGLFAGLFGLNSNELYIILHNPSGVSLQMLATAANDLSVLRATRLRATARPASFSPLAGSGLYVFRTFRVTPGSVDATVRLSRQAWETFETAANYRAEPLGLFQELDHQNDQDDQDENMLLLTWYDGFASWETSRKPSAEAVDNFRQRSALTTRTGAIATRLLTGKGESSANSTARS